MSYYDTAEICLNGHLISSSFEDYPSEQAYCSKCGSKIITNCPNCNAKLRGAFNDPYYIKTVEVTAYCYNCGKPYPWTKATIETAEAIIREDELLTEEQIQQFCECIPDLISETKKTNIALIRYKKLVDKAASVTGPALYDVLKDIAPAVIIKALFGI